MDVFEAFIEDTIPATDLRMIVSELGVTTNWSAAYTPNSGPQDGVVKVQLTDARALSAQEYGTRLRQRFQELQDDPAKYQAWLAAIKKKKGKTDNDSWGEEGFAGLRTSFDTGGMVSAALNYGATSPIEIQVIGGTTQEAYRKAREVRDRVTGVRGAADVRIQQRFDYPQLVIELDRKKADLLGLDVHEVFQTVTTVLNSSVSVDRNFWLDPRNGNQYWLAVQYREQAETSLDEVKGISLRSPRTGEVVNLGTLVQFRRLDAAPAELTHDNLANVVSIMVNTEGRDIGGVASDIKTQLQSVELPKGMVLRMTGEYERMNESFGNLGFGLVLASVLVYLLMVAQFRSYLTPMIIMLAVPLGLIGVLLILFLTQTTLNVWSIMGVIFMVGIGVSNSTLLVDFANKQRAAGASVRQAIMTASTIRLRPILMTFLATFLDLIPMAIGFGKGSEANIPLARAVVGGLVASTALTLFVVPILYELFQRDGPMAEASEDLEQALELG